MTFTFQIKFKFKTLSGVIPEHIVCTTYRLKAFSKICFSLAELATKITVSGDDTEFFLCRSSCFLANEPLPPATDDDAAIAAADNDDDDDDDAAPVAFDVFFPSVSDAGKTFRFPVACCALHFSLHCKVCCCMKLLLDCCSCCWCCCWSVLG